MPVYVTKKGEFRWAKNVVPEYRWFNGRMNQITFMTTINDKKIVQINHPDGKCDDNASRIWPFKVHQGKQPYDSKLKRFVKPKLFGKKGSGAYWADFDWGKSIKVGMKNAGLKYSGNYDFVETEMYWPINHMVAPKEDALACSECHSHNGRLEQVCGIYMPGRDANPLVEIIGLIVVVGSIIGVSIHSVMRYISNRNIGKGGHQ